MPIIQLETLIESSVDRVFDLSRCIDLHADTMSRYEEKAVAGWMSGLIESGEEVTWEATHFGVRQRLTSKITQYERPLHFRDEMTNGAFASLRHDHFFTANGSQTVMKDVFDYCSPLGIFGQIADWIFLESYMTRMLTERNELIKRIAESDEWRKFLD